MGLELSCDTCSTTLRQTRELIEFSRGFSPRTFHQGAGETCSVHRSPSQYRREFSSNGSIAHWAEVPGGRGFPEVGLVEDFVAVSTIWARSEGGPKVFSTSGGPEFVLSEYAAVPRNNFALSS